MPSRPARLLCVGKDLGLVKTRCAVLSQAGYAAQSATPSEAEVLLSTGQFDLVVMSAWLNEGDKAAILSAAADTPTLVLQGFAFPSELLAEVERLLSPSEQRGSGACYGADEQP